MASPPVTIPRVKWLAAATSPAWVEQAIARPDLLLIDHAHCERKAAGVALQLMFRYPSDGELGEQLSPLAREELAHYERVMALMRRRQIAPRPLPAPAYGAALKALVRREEPGRLLDSLLVAGLIEARSHERMALLAAHSPDAELRNLYTDLLASEARHFGLYWLLCEGRRGREATVERLEVLARAEWEALASGDGGAEQVRMHSPGVFPFPEPAGLKTTAESAPRSDPR
ncbi:MAG: tRNA-(ms[2]io[6]A)-hydroxylase [Cyanobacteriota bacterium]|nr:tRNA-(ms[2]io[6]A)-hydroxylase [Cyanobacteriota bacterium]